MTDTITLPKEALDNLIEATEGLMSWQVKNVKVWHNGAYDLASLRLKQLRAALAQQAEQGWQPIATAPKDGKWALVYADEAVNCAFVKQGELPKDWCGATMWNINPSQVTHWMPLPAAPKGGV